MAYDRIVRTIQFTAVGAGATVSLPHGLVNSQGPLRPDYAMMNASGFTGTYNSTMLSVTNTGALPADVGVMVIAIWSGAREIGGDPDLTIQPFIVAGGGGGGGSAEHVTAAAENLVSDYGAGNTDNTAALQLAFANLTTIKRAMYAPGRYALGDGAGGSTPEVTSGQKVHFWGDGSDGQSLFAFTKNAAAVFGITVDGTGSGGRLRIDDMSLLGNVNTPGADLFWCIFVDPSPPGLGQVALYNVSIDGPNQYTSAVLLNGPGNVFMEDCVLGPNVTRPLRSEEFGGGKGTWVLSRINIDSYDFCIDFGTKSTVNVDSCIFRRARDIGAGSEGINSSNAPPGGAAIPDHYWVTKSRFYPEVQLQLVKQGPYLAQHMLNSHVLGPSGIGERNGCAVVGFGSNFTSPSYPVWAHDAAVVAGQFCHNDGARIYVCTVGGTTAPAGGPTGTGTNILDGTARWDFVKAGVLALNGSAFSAVAGDNAAAGMDGLLNAVDDSQVRVSYYTFSGVALANVLRATDAGSKVWQFDGVAFENYSTVAGSTNCLFQAGENILNNCDFRRAPQGVGSASIRVTGGTSRWNQVAFRDGAVLALVDAEDSNVSLYVNGCYGIGYNIQPAVTGGHTVTLYGSGNRAIGFANGDTTRIVSNVRALEAKGADINTTTLPGQLGTLYESDYVVTDAGIVNRIFTRGIITGVFRFRAGAGFATVTTANAQGNGLASNFGYVKTTAARTVGSTCMFLQDPNDKLFYEIG